MNTFEKILLGILGAAGTVAPVLIHSQHGIMVFNAGEELLASILAQFVQKTQAPPAPAAPPAQ